ncbi:MAG: flavodoxin family protein [Planctomycetota bacterium]
MATILVVYHSQQYGNTRKLAELVAEGCRQVDGVEVTMVNVNEERVDIDAAEAADAYALGSPDYFSYVAGGLKQFFDDIYIAKQAGRGVAGKPCVLFVTHGGGGRAIDSLEQLAQAMKLEPVASSLRCQGAPSGAMTEQARGLGKALAERVGS